MSKVLFVFTMSSDLDNVEALSYRQLQAACKHWEISSSGTHKDLLKRLKFKLRFWKTMVPKEASMNPDFAAYPSVAKQMKLNLPSIENEDNCLWS